MKSKIISDSWLELRTINSRRYVKPGFPENASEHEHMSMASENKTRK